MPALRIRRYEARLGSDHDIANALRRVFEILEEAGLGGARVRFLLEDGTDRVCSCARIAADAPELAAYLQTRGRLLNFEAGWDIANPSVATPPVPREALLAAAGGIPERYPLASVVFVIGPIAWDGHDTGPSDGPLPFSTRFPAQTYISPGVIIQRLGSSKVNVTVTERTDDQEAASPSVVQKLARELGAGPARVMAVLDAVSSPAAPPGDAAEAHAQFRSELPAFIAGLALPHEIPDPSALAKVPPEAVGEVRAALVRAFKPHGWRKSEGGRGAGMHRLWKATPSGRSLALDFDTGSLLRFVTCFAKLVTEAGMFRLPVPADRTMRMQYVTPNRQVFEQVVENLTVVVDRLEESWVPRMEEALGPVPLDYQPPHL
jgi:hypothetical protein